MADSDSSEPDWLVEQASALKEKSSKPRTSGDWSSDDESPAGSQSSPASKPEPAAGKAAAKGAEAGKAARERKGRAPPSNRLPLVLAPKVRRDMMLLETGDSSVDLSGDFGCIGKLHVKQPAKAGGAGSSSADGAATEPAEQGSVAELRQTLMVDLKGKVYDADILPCNSLALVCIDGSKAKVEAVFSDFVQLAPPRDSIFDMQEVQGGDFGADFFDDGDDNHLSQGDSDDELGPLKQKRGGGKMAAKGKNAPAKKKAGAKRKAPAKGGGKTKKAR